MPDSEFQNFEVPQEVKLPEHPLAKRNKLVFALVPMAVFLVILAVATTLMRGNQPVPPSHVSVTVTPAPTPEATTNDLSQIPVATSSAFFPYVSPIVSLNQTINNMDLKVIELTPPNLDLHIRF